MKRPKSITVDRSKGVAPLAGAWIETWIRYMRLTILAVAPLAGAWIETVLNGWYCELSTVATLAGAWIET